MARTKTTAPQKRQILLRHRQLPAVTPAYVKDTLRRYRPSSDAVHAACLLSYEAVVRRITSGACDASTLHHLEAAAHAHLRSLYGDHPRPLFHVPITAKDVLLARRIAVL
jgi:hypothetical protein